MYGCVYEVVWIVGLRQGGLWVRFDAACCGVMQFVAVCIPLIVLRVRRLCMSVS